jgi:hypothetical protein
VVSAAAPDVVPSARHLEGQPAEKVLMAWNAALNRHSVDELRPLYAPKVQFYGQSWSAQQVLEAKRQAFAKEPDFRQRISGVKVEQRGARIAITFEKHSGKGPKGDIYGSLVLEQRAEGLMIVDESDAATDAKLRPQADTCSEAAMSITSSQASIQADMARVAREYPELNPGGMSYEQSDRTDRYSGSMGYFHPDRYEPRWWIDAADGKLTIRDVYSDKPLPLTAPQQALVKRLCTGKADEPAADDSTAPR